VLDIDPPVGFETRFWDRVEACSSGTAAVETVALEAGGIAPLWL
jgi:hypothetical protein